MKPAFRTGIVQSQDLANCRVRVTFADRDSLLSWWLPIVVPKTQNDKAYWMPDVGEQVVCVMDDHDEDGCVLGAIYSSSDATPVQDADKFHITFKDGAVLEYDRAAHALSVTLPQAATIALSSPGAINLTSTGAINLTSTAQIMIAQGAASIELAGGQVQITPPPIVYAEATLQ